MGSNDLLDSPPARRTVSLTGHWFPDSRGSAQGSFAFPPPKNSSTCETAPNIDVCFVGAGHGGGSFRNIWNMADSDATARISLARSPVTSSYKTGEQAVHCTTKATVDHRANHASLMAVHIPAARQGSQMQCSSVTSDVPAPALAREAAVPSWRDTQECLSEDCWSAEWGFSEESGSHDNIGDATEVGTTFLAATSTFGGGCLGPTRSLARSDVYDAFPGLGHAPPLGKPRICSTPGELAPCNELASPTEPAACDRQAPVATGRKAKRKGVKQELFCGYFPDARAHAQCRKSRR